MSNQLKDTTVYGNFNNSSKVSLTAQANFDGTLTCKDVLTGQSDVYCNGDLYLGGTKTVIDPVTGFGMLVSTGGNICVNNNGFTTVYPASVLASIQNALTTEYLDQQLSGFLQPSGILTTNLKIRGNNNDAKIYCPATTNDLSYLSGGSHNFSINNTNYDIANNNFTNVFSIATSGVSTTLSISSTSTINGLTLQENGTALSSKYQAKEVSTNPYATVNLLSSTVSNYVTIASLPTRINTLGYLLSSTAATTYVTNTSLATSLNSYLTTATAGTTYQPKETSGDPYIKTSTLTTAVVNAAVSNNLAPLIDPIFTGSVLKINNTNGLVVNSGPYNTNRMTLQSGGTPFNSYCTIDCIYTYTPQDNYGNAIPLCLNKDGGVIIGGQTSVVSNFDLDVIGTYGCNSTKYYVNGANINTIYQPIGNYSYTAKYTPLLSYDADLKPIAQLYTMAILIPSNLIKMDILLIGSGGFSGITSYRVGPGTGGGGQIVCLRDLMVTGSIILNVNPGTNGGNTNLVYNGVTIANSGNGTNGTNNTVSVVGISGYGGAITPTVDSNYFADYTIKYGSCGQPPPAINLGAPLPSYSGGYAGGCGKNGTNSLFYTGVVGTSYGPGSIGGGMSSPTETASLYKYDASYKAGGAIVTFYIA